LGGGWVTGRFFVMGLEFSALVEGCHLPLPYGGEYGSIGGGFLLYLVAYGVRLGEVGCLGACSAYRLSPRNWGSGELGSLPTNVKIWFDACVRQPLNPPLFFQPILVNAYVY